MKQRLSVHSEGQDPASHYDRTTSAGAQPSARRRERQSVLISLAACSIFLLALIGVERSRHISRALTVSTVSAYTPTNQAAGARNPRNNGSRKLVIGMHMESTGPLSKPAAVFALTDQDGRTHHLADYRGRPIILAFYPQQTPAVVAELTSFKENIRAFDTVGAKIFAISDAPQRNQKALHDRASLPFPLLSDPKGKVAARYNALDSANHIKNCTVVVDAGGWIVLSMPAKNIRPREHGKQVFVAAQCAFVPMLASSVGKIGAIGADFILPRVDTGTTETLYGDRTAKATVVFFLSAKCPCSQGYEARLKALAKKYTARHVRFLAINSSADERVWDISTHQRRAGLPFPVLRDHDNAIANQMEARVTPEAFLLDARGALQYHGRIDDDRTGQHIKSPDLANALNAVLAGKRPPVTSAPGFGCAIFRKKASTAESL